VPQGHRLPPLLPCSDDPHVLGISIAGIRKLTNHLRPGLLGHSLELALALTCYTRKGHFLWNRISIRKPEIPDSDLKPS